MLMLYYIWENIGGFGVMELIDLNIYELMERYKVTGLSIALINNSKISMAEGFGVLEAGTDRNVNNNSIFSACSISKFLTTVLVMKLSEQGILDLDEDVNKGLTSWKVPDNEFTLNNKVTLRLLLSHQAGIVDPKGSFDKLDTTLNIPKMVDLLEGRTTYCKAPIKVNYPPGSEFQYSDAGFCIIQQLIEDITETSFKDLMNEHIFKPLKMKNSSLEPIMPIDERKEFSCGHKNGKKVGDNYPIYPYPAASGLWSTPSDLAILLIELMNALKGNSKIGLSESKVEEIMTPQGCKEWSGLGVFLDRSKQDIEISSLGWGTGFQCMLVAYPHLKIGAVIMTNTDLEVHQMEGIIGEIYKSLTF